MQTVGTDENFFELGGHSLLATQLMSRIQRAFGKQLPLSALFERPTISLLAELIREQRESKPWSSIVQIRAKGANPPLFCLPGAGGNVIYFHTLASHLGPDQPVYGLQTPGLDGVTPPHSRIEDLAAHHLEEIRNVQPNGPYLLCGHSFGGRVAFEIAQQLRGDGEEIALLAVFDASAPQGNGQEAPDYGDWDEARWLETVAKIIGVLLHREIGLTVETLRRFPEEGQISVLQERLQQIGWLTPGADPGQLRGMVNVYKANVQARYAPANGPPVPITLFRAEGSEIHTDGPDLGWQKFADGPVQVFKVPGEHISMMTEPHVKRLAEKLSECISNGKPIK